MLIEYIEHLRREPPDVRRQAAFFWTAIIVGIIILIYFGALFIQNVLPESSDEPTIAAPYESQE
jgi:uncharacterized integral membrane protein